jgi:hypothetical protein
MLNFANVSNNVVADNKVSFCGLEYLLTDKEATQLKSILDGMVGSRGNTVIGTEVAKDSKAEKQYTDVQKHIDGIGYEVRKQTNKADGKEYYCIAYVAPVKVDKNGKKVVNKKGEEVKEHLTTDLRKQVNAGIKALDKITEIIVASTKADGTPSQFKAWGYATKSTAEKKIPKLATSFDYIEKVAVK